MVLIKIENYFKLVSKTPPASDESKSKTLMKGIERIIDNIKGNSKCEWRKTVKENLNEQSLELILNAVHCRFIVTHLHTLYSYEGK